MDSTVARSTLTGHLPSDQSTGFEATLRNTHITLAEVLKSNAYEKAGFVAKHFYVSKDFWVDRGFVYYQDFDVTLGLLIRTSGLAFGVKKEM